MPGNFAARRFVDTGAHYWLSRFIRIKRARLWRRDTRTDTHRSTCTTTFSIWTILTRFLNQPPETNFSTNQLKEGHASDEDCKYRLLEQCIESNSYSTIFLFFSNYHGINVYKIDKFA